uniref:Uncharacterized protein n=1 Tax=Timema bartmani TaxID=61472 RepID=A0A7R9FDG0_9NEOP|nr:unnamed protein product [Timema bartmani]
MTTLGISEHQQDPEVDSQGRVEKEVFVAEAATTVQYNNMSTIRSPSIKYIVSLGSLEEYKSLTETTEAWREVFKELNPDFQELDFGDLKDEPTS